MAQFVTGITYYQSNTCRTEISLLYTYTVFFLTAQYQIHDVHLTERLLTPT